MSAILTDRRFRRFLRWAIASVWLFNGFGKLFDMLPRHRMIAARIVGDDAATFVRLLFGAIEVVITVWVVSNFKPKACALAQTLILVLMNTFEFLRAPDLLVLGYAHFGMSALFITVVWFLALTNDSPTNNQGET